MDHAGFRIDCAAVAARFVFADSNFAVGRIATKSVISIMKQKGTNPRKSVIMESPQNQ
jgi:hypothetical protein